MTRKRAPTTLFSDVGGVLIENPWNYVADDLSAAYGLDRKQVFDELEFLSKGMDRGQTDARSFSRQLSLRLKRDIPEDRFETLLLDTSPRRIVPAWDALSHLKSSSDLRIVALSNMSREFWASLVRKFRITSLFDSCVLSYEHGVIKPDPAIFEIALGETGSPPRECVFLDDTVGNIRAAEKIGLRTRLATSPDETAAFLNSLGR